MSVFPKLIRIAVPVACSLLLSSCLIGLGSSTVTTTATSTNYKLNFTATLSTCTPVPLAPNGITVSCHLQVSGGPSWTTTANLPGITPASLPALRDAASGLKGILWVDKVGNISALLADYRRYMSWVVIFSYVGVYLLLVPRYRGRTWRVLAPAALASIGTVALFGITGVGLQLFHVLALMLLLGIGVDYGIFFQEHPTQRDPTAWLATVLSSVSTLLSFGLLALSKTPALRAFGLTLLIGITTVALIVPCFASEANSAQKPAAPKD